MSWKWTEGTWKKVSQILPGLISAIVSFTFRTAGSVIGACLLILGVVIFAVEEFQKKHQGENR